MQVPIPLGGSKMNRIITDIIIVMNGGHCSNTEKIASFRGNMAGTRKIIKSGMFVVGLEVTAL